MDNTEKKLALIPLFVVALAACVFMGTADLFYEGNDDMAMLAMVKGLFGISATYETIFMSLPMSYVLYVLYKAVNHVPWYAINLYAILLLAFYLSIFVGLRVFKGLVGRFSLTVVLTIFFWKIGGGISFTSVALIAFFAAVAGFLCSLRDESPSPILNLLVPLLLVLAYGLRPSILGLGVALIIPVVLLFGREIRAKLSYSLLIIFPVVIVCLLDVGGILVLRTHSDFGWWLSDYNMVRSKFNDYNRTVSPEAVAAAGWSSVDYVVAKNWWLHDRQLFGLENINKFLVVNEKTDAADEVNLNIRILDFFREFKAVAVTHRDNIAIVALLGALLLLGRGSSPSAASRKRLVLCGLLANLIILVLIMGLRFPTRVAYPAFVALALTLPFYLEKWGPPAERPGRLWQGAGLLGLVVLLVLVGADFKRIKEFSGYYNEKARERDFLAQDFLKLDSSGSEVLFVELNPVISGNTILYKPFDEERDEYKVKKIPGGSFVMTNAYMKFISEHFDGCTDNSVVCLLRNENVIYYFYDSVSQPYDAYTGYFVKHLSLNYSRYFPGKRFALVPVFDGRTKIGMLFRGPLFLKAVLY